VFAGHAGSCGCREGACLRSVTWCLERPSATWSLIRYSVPGIAGIAA
jgi:hypothetical protein